jgi:ATP-dependent helicase YprA (DUF1998 family)
VDVFGVRDRLIEDYREFTGSFVDIHDPDIADHVRDRMARGYQWPDPWLSLNPSFASGGTITDLVAEGLLQPECERIFRLKDENPDGPVLRLHQHQREAIEAARTGASYVLTTGTGSGKSLAYIIPVVDRVLSAKAAGTYRPGIKAIAVYPMSLLHPRLCRPSAVWQIEAGSLLLAGGGARRGWAVRGGADGGR